MQDKKIISEIAIGVIVLLVVIIGAIFLLKDGKSQSIPEQEAITSQATMPQLNTQQSRVDEVAPVNVEVKKVETVKSCPSINFPGCKGDYKEISGGKDVNGCDLEPICKKSCPEINFPGCKGDYREVSGGKDAAGCALAPTCKKICPEISSAGCRSGYEEISGGKDKNGCRRESSCKKICPEVSSAGCRSGYEEISGGKDADGCTLESTCELQN